MSTTPHPGWECCDPTKDLRGWIDRERVRVAVLRRWARVLHARGQRLDRASLTEVIAGNHGLAAALAAESRAAHALANAHGQDAMVREGHVGRVEEAHSFRLVRDRERTLFDAKECAS